MATIMNVCCMLTVIMYTLVTGTEGIYGNWYFEKECHGSTFVEFPIYTGNHSYLYLGGPHALTQMQCSLRFRAVDMHDNLWCRFKYLAFETSSATLNLDSWTNLTAPSPYDIHWTFSSSSHQAGVSDVMRGGSFMKYSLTTFGDTFYQGQIEIWAQKGDYPEDGDDDDDDDDDDKSGSGIRGWVIACAVCVGILFSVLLSFTILYLCKKKNSTRGQVVDTGNLPPGGAVTKSVTPPESMFVPPTYDQLYPALRSSGMERNSLPPIQHKNAPVLGPAVQPPESSSA